MLKNAVAKVEEHEYATYIKAGGRARHTWKRNEILVRTEYTNGTVRIDIVKKDK